VPFSPPLVNSDMVSGTGPRWRGGPKRGLAATIGLLLSLASCDTECILPPCALPIAIEVTVTSGLTGGPVSGASLTVTGAGMSTIACESSCVIPGQVGTYQLSLTAPGFPALQRTVQVHGTSPRCGCPLVDTEQVDFVVR